MPDSLPEQLRKKYKYKTNAEALFFKNVHGDPAFRFEATDLGWEFSDGFYIGPDPKGTFFYNEDFTKLPKDRPTDGTYYVDQWKDLDSHELYAWIQFYASGSDNTVLGEFLGKDEFNVVASSDLLHKHGLKGTWKKTDYVVGNATAIKAKDNATVTIRCGAQHKDAKFTCAGQLYHDFFETDGRLTIKDIKAINKAKCVRWYHDYVVFLEGLNAKDFSAFFFPSEGPVTDPLGKENNGYWESVVWSDN